MLSDDYASATGPQRPLPKLLKIDLSIPGQHGEGLPGFLVNLNPFPWHDLKLQPQSLGTTVTVVFSEHGFPAKRHNKGWRF